MFFGYSVSDDIRDWMVENFHWAIENELLTPETPLILPTKRDFPAPSGDHRKTAGALVDAIARHLGIDPEEMDVVAQDVLPAEYQIDYNALGEVGGTWQDPLDGPAVVTYNPNLTRMPMTFLSMLIHEVIHHRLHMTTSLDLPGGLMAEELGTDLHCITAGFGVISMTGAEQAVGRGI